MPVNHVPGQASHVQLRIDPAADRSGVAAAEFARDLISSAIAQRDEARVVFAAAPSQEEFLKHLGAQPGIDWSKVRAFHMDEYIGLEPTAPQSFARWLADRLPPLQFEPLVPGTDPAVEIRRYAALVSEAQIDVTFLGIGVNGHIAFNEPGQCRFDDPETVRLTTLDQASRQQQVDDGCFAGLDAVPRQALTLTVPALLRSSAIVGVVQGAHKAAATARMVGDPIDPACPATALRTHPNVTMFLDAAAASRLPS